MSNNDFLDDYGPRRPFARGVDFTSTSFKSERNKMTFNNEVRAAEYGIDTTYGGVRLLSGYIALIDPHSPPAQASSYVITAKIHGDVADDVVFNALDEAIFTVENRDQKPTDDDYNRAIDIALRAIGALPVEKNAVKA